jgi:hypothetical protein
MTFGEYHPLSLSVCVLNYLLHSGGPKIMHWMAICVSHVCRHYLRTNVLTTGALDRILEMQVIIVTLLENFEFSLPPQTEKTRIYRKPNALMVPSVEGRQGAWLGLVVKSLEG